MSEQPVAADMGAASGTVSPGGALRQAREAAGMHIGALAVALKVPVRKLEALEADRWEQLPDTVFVRALASSVCRVLKIDARPVLALMPQSRQPALVPEPVTPEQGHASLSTSTRSLGLAQRMRSPIRVSSRWLLVTMLLIGAGLAVVMALNPRGFGSRVQPEPMAVAPSPWSPPETAASLAAQPASPPLVQVSSSAAPQGVVGSGGAASAAGETTLNPLVFRARGPTWVEVTDARGVVQARKTLSSGEMLGVGGVRPLTVVVGRADMTDVEVLGRSFDLGPYVRDQVARFDVQ